MKKPIALLFAFVTLIGSALACASSTQVPAPKIRYTGPQPTQTAAPTQPEAAPTASASGIPTSVVCHEKPGNDLPFRTWHNADAPYSHYTVQVVDIGPAADGESVWLSTTGGLARLNLQTWQCDLLTQAAGVPLANTSQVVLPDGEGGSWVGAGQHLLRLSDEGWQVAYQDPSDVISISLGQMGDLCLNMFKYYHRGFDAYKLCFEGSELPLPSPEKIEDCYGEACPLRPSNCDMWQSMSGQENTFGRGYRYYKYTTPDECERMQQIEAVFADDDSDVLVAFSEDGSKVWGVKSKYSENASLLYQTDGVLYQEEIPYYVRGLAADHVYGGAWLVVEDGLVHIKVKVGDGGMSFAFQPLSVDFQIPSLDTGPFPDEARGLVVDEADRVWAVNGKSVLLYDGADASHPAESWQEAVSPAGGADAIAADPKYGVWPSGVWVAGRGELVHLDGTHQQTWPMPDTLTSAPTALLIDRSGRVWMGTTENGVWTAVPSLPEGDPLTWRVFTPEDGLGSAAITALAQGPRGCIYAAHLAGIGFFCPWGEIESGRWTALTSSNLSEHGWVNALAFAPTGELWAGTHPEGHLQRYDGRWTDFSPAWYASIGALLVDDAGTLWAGASREWNCGGVRYRSAAGEGELDWQAFDPEGLAVCNVFALAQDSRGRIWIGGPGGVVMWEGE